MAHPPTRSVFSVYPRCYSVMLLFSPACMFMSPLATDRQASEGLPVAYIATLIIRICVVQELSGRKFGSSFVSLVARNRQGGEQDSSPTTRQNGFSHPREARPSGDSPGTRKAFVLWRVRPELTVARCFAERGHG